MVENKKFMEMMTMMVNEKYRGFGIHEIKMSQVPPIYTTYISYIFRFA